MFKRALNVRLLLVAQRTLFMVVFIVMLLKSIMLVALTNVISSKTQGIAINECVNDMWQLGQIVGYEYPQDSTICIKGLQKPNLLGHCGLV